MTKLLLFLAFAFIASPVAAQQQGAAGPSAGDKPAASTGKKGESDYERRIRAEGAAGGTAPVPKEEREGVGAGAKAHMHFDPIQRGMHRRSDAEVIAPSK